MDAYRRELRDLLAITMQVAALGLWPAQADAALVLSPDGTTVYDTVNSVSWLADANLAATNRFGVPVCTASVRKSCINASGSMSYDAAVAWVAAMNAASYLGHAVPGGGHAQRRRSIGRPQPGGAEHSPVPHPGELLAACRPARKRIR